MISVLETLVFFVEPMAPAILLVYFYGFFRRSIPNDIALNGVIGCMFGLAAAAAMADPIEISDGVIVDTRFLFIGVAAAYFGFLSGLIALCIGILVRVQIGGDGVSYGIAGMLIATVAGLFWARYVRPRLGASVRSNLALAALLSLHILSALPLPSPLFESFFYEIAPILFVANVLGVLILGKLIERERYLITETDRLKTESIKDPLTKIMNRDAAVSSFAMRQSRGIASEGTAMLCIDVDNFKQINDTHGHLSGDKVLVELSQRLSSCLRPGDVFARMSGDEFVIILYGLQPDQVRGVAARCVSTAARKPVMTEQADIAASISIGAVWSDTDMSFDALRACADEQLYVAKKRGRNCVAFKEVDAVPDHETAAA